MIFFANCPKAIIIFIFDAVSLCFCPSSFQLIYLDGDSWFCFDSGDSDVKNEIPKVRNVVLSPPTSVACSV